MADEMKTRAQYEASVRTVRAMVDAAAVEMNRVRPSARLAKFDELPVEVQNVMCSNLHQTLAPIAAILERHGR